MQWKRIKWKYCSLRVNRVHFTQNGIVNKISCCAELSI